MKLLCALGLLSLCLALISAQDNSTDTTATTPGPEVNATTENPVTPGNTTEQPTTTAITTTRTPSTETTPGITFVTTPVTNATSTKVPVTPSKTTQGPTSTLSTAIVTTYTPSTETTPGVTFLTTPVTNATSTGKPVTPSKTTEGPTSTAIVTTHTPSTETTRGITFVTTPVTNATSTKSPVTPSKTTEGPTSASTAITTRTPSTETTPGITSLTTPFTIATSTENPVTPSKTTEGPTSTATTPIVTTAGPASGNLYYLPDRGVICILLQADISFNISYLKDDQTRGYMVYELPDNTSVTVRGSCDASNQFMTIEFRPDPATPFTARFNFEENSSKERYARNLVLDYVLTPALFPGVNATGPRVATSPNGTYFEASESNQYICKSNTTIKLDDDVAMMTYELNVQSFLTGNTTDFSGSRQQCPADAETNNIVPIAVGAALAALVVIVLIAYLISRNRNKGGYESV